MHVLVQGSMMSSELEYELDPNSCHIAAVAWSPRIILATVLQWEADNRVVVALGWVTGHGDAVASMCQWVVPCLGR